LYVELILRLQNLLFMLDLDLFSVDYGTHCSIAKRVRKVCLVTTENTLFPSEHAHNPQVGHLPKSAMPHLWHPQRLISIGFAPFTAFFNETKVRDVHGDVYEQVLELQTQTTYESESFCTRAENRKVHALILLGTGENTIGKWISHLRLLDKTDSNAGMHHWQLTAKSQKRANYLSTLPAFVGTTLRLNDLIPLSNNHPYFAVAIDQTGQRWKCRGSVTGEIEMTKYP
jgi:hypothetical protein